MTEVEVATQELVEPQAETIARFRADLDALIAPRATIGLAVRKRPSSAADSASTSFTG